MTFSKKQINLLLNIITYYGLDEDGLPEDYTINIDDIENYCKWHDLKPQSYKKLFTLEEYLTKFNTDGEHKHDGQVVEYCFTFISPSGEVTELTTSMSFISDFCYNKSFEIN